MEGRRGLRAGDDRSREGGVIVGDIDGATHVLHWGPWCGGTWRDTDGLWELLTREDFDAGREFIQDRGDWYATGSRKADPEQLTGWVAGLLGVSGNARVLSAPG